MKAELIVNLTAGGGKPHKHLNTVLKYLKENGLNFKVCTTSHQGEAVELAQKAADNGAELIVSVGGDGTVNEIVNGIMKSKNDPPLGIIPLGWANDFIKSTDIPSDIIEACKILIKGKTKKIDIGVINNQIYFANICGVGFDAEVAQLANHMKSKHPNLRILSAFVYVFATVKKLLSPFSYHNVKIKFDGQEIHSKILFIAISNGKIYGGRFKITPEAILDDGLLEICLVEEMGRFKYLSIIPKVFKGTHASIKGINFYRAKEVVIQSSEPVLAQVSGEVIEGQKEFTITLLPKSLKLIVP
ncbi:MAG: diacylglycerol kinase family protein [bacterium]|nr:diacylglycerol kinase family lipid kinase [bacterium]MBU1290449.1 diacylglycerol kinase family lipid kinase [bacterium]MBU1428345.1 diacylglycerol kinase family lipid kinase [bacterium]MBU2439686.1 diacylglycerol kinase family lipid kinase [bacterium]